MALFTPRSLTEMIEVPLNLCGVSGFGPFLIDVHWGWGNIKYDCKNPFCQSYACLLKCWIFHYQILQGKSNSSCHEYVKESQIRPEVCYLHRLWFALHINTWFPKSRPWCTLLLPAKHKQESPSSCGDTSWRCIMLFSQETLKMRCFWKYSWAIRAAGTSGATSVLGNCFKVGWLHADYLMWMNPERVYQNCACSYLESAIGTYQRHAKDHSSLSLM